MNEKNEAQGLTEERMEQGEDLLLELSEPKMITKNDGSRRAQAKAKLSYIPSGKGKRRITGEGTFQFTAPVGPIENQLTEWANAPRNSSSFKSPDPKTPGLPGWFA